MREEKLKRKGCDWILANDVSPATGIMGGDRNTIELVTANGVEPWPPQSKRTWRRCLWSGLLQPSRNSCPSIELSLRLSHRANGECPSAKLGLRTDLAIGTLGP